MNIIGNNCIASRLYRINNEQFNNPFIWASTPYPEFIKVIENFEKIDFSKIAVEFDECKRTNNKSSVVICDNCFKVHFIHYIQDENSSTPCHKANSGGVVNC